MSTYEIILIAVALATDAFALTLSNCATYRNSLSRKKEWSMPVAFAVFQFLMPIIGYYAGSLFSSRISSVAGFITAGVFLVLTAKIVFDIIKDGKNENKENSSAFTYPLLLIQAVATSIDALVVGITFSVSLTFSVFIACAVIGGITFILVTVALFIGKGLNELFGKYARWLGAAILFALTIKNLVQACL